jgi:hypothetical protein
MTTTLRLSAEDRFSLADLIHKFYQLVDSGRASETVSMFSADATLEFGPGSPKPGIIRGAEITLAMRERERLAGVKTRHAISNIRLSRLNESQASAHYLATLFRAEIGSDTTLPAFVLDVDETWIRAVEDWQILGRVVTPIFIRQ